MDIKPIASGSKGNCYIISDESTTIILDAGIPFKKIQEALNFKIGSVSAAIITHAHLDHAEAVPTLLSRGVDVYAPEHTLRARGAKESHRAHETIDRQQFNVGTFTIMPISVPHDIPCNAYIVLSNKTKEKLLYITDAQYCPVRTSGLTHILLETNYDDEVAKSNVENGVTNRSYLNRVLQTHMSIGTAIELLKANDLSKLKQVYLIHMSDKNAKADEFKRKVQEATGAEVINC